MKILDACCGSKLGQRRCKTVWLVFFKEKEK